ncbi:hypothetical protein FAX15_21495 [Escherichia coli]|nr:hypothetical protein FAX15_21495 [Escherichia coli]
MRCNLDSAYGACDQHSPFFSAIPQMQNKKHNPMNIKENMIFDHHKNINVSLYKNTDNMT